MTLIPFTRSEDASWAAAGAAMPARLRAIWSTGADFSVDEDAADAADAQTAPTSIDNAAVVTSLHMFPATPPGEDPVMVIVPAPILIGNEPSATKLRRGFSATVKP